MAKMTKQGDSKNGAKTAVSVAPKKDAQGLYHDLDHFAGLWTKKEADEFDKELAVMRRF